MQQVVISLDTTQGPEQGLLVKPTILIVEDNPVERQLIGKILRNADFDTIAVGCGDVVLETVINCSPDLILLDALLPDIDGFEVCQRLRAHSKGLYIPLIMLTGLDDVESIDRAYEVGATDFFTKPINSSLLVHRIRNLLRARVIMDQLRVSKQSLASAQSVARLGHWEVDIEKGDFSASEELYRLYGFPPGYQKNDHRVIVDRCHPEDYAWVEREIKAAIFEQREARLEHRIVLGDGSVRYLEVHLQTVQDEGDNSSHILGLSMDVSDRKESEKEILRLSYFDRLTGLPNRSLLDLVLNQAIPKAHMQGMCTGVLALDLDLFNRVNNSMGHAAGDVVLEQLTTRLTAILNCIDNAATLARLSTKTEILNPDDRDVLARLAADTFIIILPLIDRESDTVLRFAKKVKASFQRPFSYRGQELFVTASVGIAYSESGGSDAETMIQQADLALHDAKTEGRNEIRQYRGDLVAKVSNHLSIQGDLRKALQNGEFQVFYQPKIRLKDGAVSGFEALVRWYHPVKGMIPPDQFISIAEDTGQIVALGEWVLKTACRQNQRWIDEGLVDSKIAVNVAARQFKETGIVDKVFAILDETGLSPDRLELEMTEGVLMSDPKTGDLVAQLRERGVSIALDDFGTGYSSLSYITRFPIDTIKIDRCFIMDITLKSEKAAIVSAVTNLSHTLEFNVVAEGVETEDELAVIKSLGCDEVQGYYYCRPMSAADICDWLKERQHSRPELANAN